MDPDYIPHDVASDLGLTLFAEAYLFEFLR